ncbi:MAG TPA: riboflavin biosynthesis protein RibD [Fibrobacteres bacterium]|jgi:dihydrofolate reductase|nr:riboflavin biosynthesis protein RibD [Fibrobacterota bacterium]
MRKLIAITQLSLDGVMQAPGGPDEDPRSNFTHGGWFMGFDDDAVPKAMDKLISGKFDLLLGRRTYDIFASYWPQHVDNPIGKAFGKVVKYVVTSRDNGLDWKTSVRVGGKAAEGVRKLKATKGPPLHVWGSSELLQTLIAAGLVDEYQFWVAPVVLGYGKRLFGPGAPPQKLELVDGKIGSGGVLVNTYRPAGPLPEDSNASPKSKRAAAKKPAKGKG